MTDIQKPFRQPDYRLETMDNELLLFHPVKTDILYLNQTASVIWQLCDGQRTIQDIIQLLSDAYPEAASGMKADVHEALDTLVKHGAVGLA